MHVPYRGPQKSGATAKHLVALTTLLPEFMRPWFSR